jgi:Flp pilus assembly protein TadB
VLARAGVRVGARVLPDLPICDRTPQRHMAEKAATALVGLVLPGLLAVALPAVGAGQLPGLVWAGGAVLLALAGFYAPDAGVAAEAAKRRGDARHAISGFLDLTVIGLAGGAGVEQALAQAAASGRDPTTAAIRRALEQAAVRREPLWLPLDRLGTTLGLAELRELAASLSLAGTEGAKIRASLAAKAAALRIRLLTDIETHAQAATERMSLPLVVMFAGFLLFIAYPALTQVTTGL